MKKRFRWDTNYLYWGVTAFLVIVCGTAVFLLMSQWPSVRASILKILNVVSPIIYGLMFAYLFNKLMVFLEKMIISRLTNRVFRNRPRVNKRRASRITSVALTMVIALLIIFGTLTLILPQILVSLRTLVISLPVYYDTSVRWLTDTLEGNSLIENAAVDLASDITARLNAWLQTTLLTQATILNVLGGVIGTIRVIANLLIGLVISVYVLYHKERLCAQAKKLTYGIFNPKWANRIVDSARFLDKTCGSFITSKLIDSLIVGIVCYFAMIILRMPYAMLIAVIIGITNIIPFFGPFIGGIPSILLILLINPTQGLVFAIFVVILQQLDGNVLYPKIQGGSIGMSGFWIICALLFFGGLFGFWGMLLGVPVFAAVYALVKSINISQLKNRGLPEDTNSYKTVDFVDESTNELVHKNCIPKTQAVNPPQDSDTGEDDKQDC